MQSFIFPIAWSGKVIFLKKCKVHSVRRTSFTFTCVKLRKRPEVNSESTRSLTFMKNGRAFPHLDGMSYSLTCVNQF